MGVSGVKLLFLLPFYVYSYNYQEPYIFAYEWGNATFRHSMRSSRFHYLFYKGTENDSILLRNSSDPSQLSSNSNQSDKVSVSFTSWKSPYFQLSNLTVSDSGDYRIEIWDKDTLKQKIFYGLTVCTRKLEVKKEEAGGTIELTITNVNQSQGDILQIYRDSRTFCSGTKRQTILDTSQSFEILPRDLKGTANLLSNSSTIHISNLMGHGHGDCHHILLWKEGQCQLYTEREWSHVHSFVYVASSVHTVRKGARFTFKVHPLVAGQVHWYHESSSEEIRQRLPFNITPEEEKGTDMYVDLVNYSLVIPSASTEHDGVYCYYSQSHPQESFPRVLHVCSERNATNLTYSAGDTAVLKCEGLWVSEWYHQKDTEQERLVVKMHQPGLYYVHQWLRDRVNISQNDSLTVSGLSPQDSGVYRCRGWKGSPSQKGLCCLEQRIQLIYVNPFGVNSVFYRLYVSLMGFGLLVMISLLISARWRCKGGG